MAAKENMAQRPVSDHELVPEVEESHGRPDIEPISSDGGLGDTTTKQLWTTFKVVIETQGDKSQPVDFTASLQPVRMQYLFQHHMDTMNTQLKNIGVQIKKIVKGEVIVKALSNIGHIDEILGEIVSTLEDATKKISMKLHPISDDNMRSAVFREAYENCDGMDVIIYDDGKSSIVLVGKTAGLNVAYEKLKQITDDKQKKTREIDVGSNKNMKIIANLDFLSYFLSKTDAKFRIDAKNGKLIFDKSSRNEIRRYEKMMKEFISSVNVTKVALSPAVANLLQSKETQTYISARMKKRNVKGCFTQEQGNVLECRNLSSAEGKHAIGIVQSSFQNIRLDKEMADSEKIKRILQQLQTKCLTRVIDETLVEITATNDVILQIMSVMEQTDGDFDSKSNPSAVPGDVFGPDSLVRNEVVEKETCLSHHLCDICLKRITDPKWLPCKHVFCRDCIDQLFKFKPSCPQCGAVHGKIIGDQPPGTMKVTIQHTSLPGYESCKTIAITYTFPSGFQSQEHQNPGKFYLGIERTGYLPDNDKGRLVAKLLKIAFDRKLVLTIGRSVTTGSDGVIIWNDIHHKTRTHGGPQIYVTGFTERLLKDRANIIRRGLQLLDNDKQAGHDVFLFVDSFGYPDPTYLDRVLDELAAKGVTKESLNDP